MNKIAILIAGWHFPKYFYTQMSNLIVPDGYEFDNFIVSHRDIDLPIVHDEKIKILSRINKNDTYGKMDYELYSEKPSRKYFESLGKIFSSPVSNATWYDPIFLTAFS